MIALVTALEGDDTVAALVDDRVYPQVMPDKVTLPALVYTRVSGTPANSLRGHTGELEEVIVQIDCIAKTYSEAQTLANAVHDLLGTDRAVAGLQGFRQNRSDNYDDSNQLHSVTMDFRIWM